MLIFLEGEIPEYPRQTKTLRAGKRTNNKLNPHLGTKLGSNLGLACKTGVIFCVFQRSQTLKIVETFCSHNSHLTYIVNVNLSSFTDPFIAENVGGWIFFWNKPFYDFVFLFTQNKGGRAPPLDPPLHTLRITLLTEELQIQRISCFAVSRPLY